MIIKKVLITIRGRINPTITANQNEVLIISESDLANLNHRFVSGTCKYIINVNAIDFIEMRDVKKSGF